MIYNTDFKRNLNFNEFISVEDFKNYPLSLDTPMSDAQIKSMIFTSGLLIQKVITRPIVRTSIVDSLKGNDTDLVFLEYPVNELIRVYDKTCNSDVSMDYVNIHSSSNDRRPLYRNQVKRTDDLWSSECYYEISYTSGDFEFPEEVKMATILTAANLINKEENRGIKSVKISDLQVVYGSSGNPIPQEAMFLLSDWISKQYVI
jgi:hypothetical protein